MVTRPIRQPTTVPGTGRPPVPQPSRPTFTGDVHALARALAVPPGEARWRERLILRLAPVHRSFAEHVRTTEGPAGRYAELLDQAPRLDHGVRLLTREHTAIAAALAALQRAAEVPGVPCQELCGRAGHLLRALARHRQRGADLIWQAYQTDLGGET
ncbi:hypothetical protein [Micromonospora mirobrigensis]|uniref:Hemerythrin HHE cation binding domain-containing protein n=1 Tax=Micromonospora mirobrigensis TaxID=262898 RepID=A0A1C4UHD3_9ACTN|nr:hypothetical protein [Micromonospora mirobrigensis]SCE71105.1 hypothetical protein GA0070564_101477 [Micromonospora mirobrigensis]